MRSIKFNLSKKNLSAWDAAVTLTEAYLTNECKADQLLEELNEIEIPGKCSLDDLKNALLKKKLC